MSELTRVPTEPEIINISVLHAHVEHEMGHMWLYFSHKLKTQRKYEKIQKETVVL